MSIPRYIPPLVALVTATALVTAHPIPVEHHDRTVFVRLTDKEVMIEYTLALDSRTQAKDLYALRQQIGKPPELDQINGLYAELYGPRIAAGLVGRVDGQAIAIRYDAYELRIEDHLRYILTLSAPLPLGSRAEHHITIVDSNFALEPGVLRLAIRGNGSVELAASNAPDDPQRARPMTVADLAGIHGERLRTVEATFHIGARSATASASGSVASQPGISPATFWETLRSFELRRLVDSDRGLAMLLVLAFIFGAVHALQPGHGKTLVAAYLVGEQGTVAHALFLGLVTTLTHTSSAILLALVIPLLYPQVETEVEFALELGCGLLIVFMALWLLLRRLAGQADHVHLFGGHHHHHHDEHDHHHHLPTGQRVSLWALVSLGVTGGVVPCVDALALLTLTLLAQKLWLGLPLILAFSLGLASVLVTVGVLVVKFKRFADSRWGGGRFVKMLPILAAALTLLLGLWMCREALRNHEERLQTLSTIREL
jgi:ABC-type nickel/cobalt efflux system permease component RcnA